MSRQPGADELRIRGLLRKLGVGPDAPPPAMPAAPPPPPYKPAPAREEWWSPAEPVEDDTDDETDEEQDEKPRPFAPQPDYWPRPHIPAALTTIPDKAEAAISPGTRRLLYNTTAAGAGWALGLYQQFAAALADCGTNYSIGGAIVLGTGGTALIAHLWDRRTRHWWPGIAWVARIPLATAVLALALWAPAAA